MPSRKTNLTTSATLKDLARLAGVSPITASRALHKPELVAQETRARVIQAVEQSGYVPNSLAGALTSRQTRLVAAIVPSIAHTLFSDMVDGMLSTFASHRYEMTLGVSHHDPLNEEKWLATLLSRRPDGVVLTGTEHTARSRRLLLNAGIPVAELWDYVAHPLDICVGFSHEDVGRAAYRHLSTAGHRHCAVLRGDDSRAARRGQGFRRAAADDGKPSPLEIVVPADLPQASRGRAALEQLRALDASVDAVFCSTDTLAHGVLAHAHSLGLHVPSQLGVLGFGDEALATNSIPALSTVRVEGSLIGRAGAEALIARMGGLDVATSQDVGFQVLARASTGT